MNKTYKKLTIIGIIFIFAFGALTHFLFDISGNLSIVGAIAPVNESVWEHLKLILLPTFIYGIYEYIKLKGEKKNFFTAKAAQIISGMAIIVIIFYSYTAFTGHSILLIDILAFLAAVILGQLISYKIMTSAELPEVVEFISIIVIIAIIIIFIIFTFNPPHNDIFQDPNDGRYGIKNKLR